MTKKKFKKLLMACRIQRNDVDKIHRIMLAADPSVKVVAGVGWVTKTMRAKALIIAPVMLVNVRNDIFGSHAD